jgi:hypothetical protein
MNRCHLQSQRVAAAAAALRRVVRAIACISVLTSFSALGAEIELPGTYQLVSASINYLDTGEIIPDIYGKTAKGFIMYGTDGRMLAVITNDNRPKPESIAKTTDEQRIALYRTMQAYGGTYKFDGKTVEHNVDICWDEVRCGTVVARDIKQDGDVLVYTTRPAPFSGNGRLSVVTLAWRKVK